MVSRRKTDPEPEDTPEGGSSVVVLTDADGREHYTARGSAAHRKLAKDGATEQSGEVAESGTSTPA
jgi:hypothetical protein